MHTLFHSIPTALWGGHYTLIVWWEHWGIRKAKQPDQGHTVNVSVETECRQLDPRSVLSPDMFKPEFELVVCSGVRSQGSSGPQHTVPHWAWGTIFPYKWRKRALRTVLHGLWAAPRTGASCLSSPWRKAGEKRCYFQNMLKFNLKMFSNLFRHLVD